MLRTTLQVDDMSGHQHAGAGGTRARTHAIGSVVRGSVHGKSFAGPVTACPNEHFIEVGGEVYPVITASESQPVVYDQDFDYEPEAGVGANLILGGQRNGNWSPKTCKTKTKIVSLTT